MLNLGNQIFTNVNICCQLNICVYDGKVDINIRPPRAILLNSMYSSDINTNITHSLGEEK